MKRFCLILCLFFVAFALTSGTAVFCAETTIREYQKAWPTYPYYDADPVPAFTKFYPYFRFDGFSDKSVQQKWKVVELSNDYISLEILPEIGGKIWTVTEKSSGRSVIYSNPVVKFRDVGMRGPWTSGGIEFNVGIIGHTPNCSSPVDYAVRKNSDGSASCFIGTLDLIARAWWSVEIRLPASSSLFAMNVKWHNASGQNQTYYNWTNVGFPAKNDLECIDPGTHYVGHGGDAHPWPLDPDSGRNLAWYKNNDFGSYKSYHIVGKPSEFYGAYLHDDDYGVASFLSMDAKRGRKIWMWGLSRQGMIWEDLLTDPPAGQYVEIQAGRLFNQCRGTSSFTPYKDREFAPYSTELWTEYWMPVLATKGFNAVSPAASMNVIAKGKEIAIRLCPNHVMKESIRIYDGAKLLHEETLDLTPTKTVSIRKEVKQAPKDLRVVLGSDLLAWPAEGNDSLTRPVVSQFDQKSKTSPTAFYYQGREAARAHQWEEAVGYYKRCLELDPLFTAAYTALAEEANRRGEYRAACQWCRKALSIDTYDVDANYQFGLASFREGRLADAKEAFGLCALPEGKRAAALTALAMVYLSEKRYGRAYETAQRALVYNSANTDAWCVAIASLRNMSSSELEKTGKDPAQMARNMIHDNPLAFPIRAELFLIDNKTQDDFLDTVRCELPHEIFLELATWYRRVGRNEDAVKLLRLALKKKDIRQAEIRYWLAYLTKDKTELARAESTSLDFCFPSRIEAVDVFRWACENGKTWRPSWCLAVVRGAFGYTNEAENILTELGDRPDYAPFYALRGQLVKANSEKDFARAVELAPDEPRYVARYCDVLANNGKYNRMLELTQTYTKRFPIDTRLVLLHARALLYLKKYSEAFDYMTQATFLPNEGSLLGRDLYRQAALSTAALAYKKNDLERALEMIEKAREWPENIGAGKPYPDGCDERLEDWLAFLVQTKKGNAAKARTCLDAILKPINARHTETFAKAPYSDLLTALALRESGRTQEADDLLKKTLSSQGDWMRNYFQSQISTAGKDDDIVVQILSLLPKEPEHQSRKSAN